MWRFDLDEDLMFNATDLTMTVTFLWICGVVPWYKTFIKDHNQAEKEVHVQRQTTHEENGVEIVHLNDQNMIHVLYVFRKSLIWADCIFVILHRSNLNVWSR